MKTFRHGNRHLSSEEIALLKAWVWEEAHREKEGPAHRLFREHGIDLGQPLAILHAADFELLADELRGDRLAPQGWPWGEKSLDGIAADLRKRRAALPRA